LGLAKSIGTALGTMRAMPHLWRYSLGKVLLGHTRAFCAASEQVGAIPGFFGVYTRKAFYKRVLSRVGVDVYFGYQSFFSKAGATVGDRVYIGRFCTIGLADLGNDVMLADGVQVLSGRHQHGNEVVEEGKTLRDNPQVFSKVTIGAGAWIGAGAIIMADVGDHAVVGAGAVVIKPVPDFQRVAGVPAKPIRDAVKVP
jgi:virginiamycin A acetyltransferase